LTALPYRIKMVKQFQLS